MRGDRDESDALGNFVRHIRGIPKNERGLQGRSDKIQRSSSFSNFNDFLHPSPCAQTIFSEKIVGTIVLTDYNNNTYRIDDIEFDVTPRDTFVNRQGVRQSYMEYYKKKYDISIKHEFQPLLVSNLSKGKVSSQPLKIKVCLIPELCRATGETSQFYTLTSPFRDFYLSSRKI